MSISFDVLLRAAKENKLAHLLLFHGSGSREREGAVLQLALVLNCKGEDPPCGHCSGCRKNLSRSHPDFHWVKPLKTSIGIEQINHLQEVLHRQIYEGNQRICLIEEAEKASLPAANALLRICEDPPENTVIVLSTNNPDGLPATLRSRAQEIYFPAPGEGEWADQREAYALSGGDPDLARQIAQYGVEKTLNWLNQYMEAVFAGDYQRLYLLCQLDKEESILLAKSLISWVKPKVAGKQLSPAYLIEMNRLPAKLNRQASHRLAWEVLALKLMKLGGTTIG